MLRLFHYCPTRMSLQGMFPQCCISCITYCTYMNTQPRCKYFLWSHITDGFTVVTNACHLLQKTHIHYRWVFLGGHGNRLSVVDLHVACLEVPFAWNLCIQTQPHDIHLVPETVNHACESGHSLAGHCQVSLLLWEAWLHALRWHLRLPNVVQSFLSKSTDQFLFCSEQQKSLSDPENQFRLHFFRCACVIRNDKKCVFSLLLSLTCPSSFFPCLPMSLMVSKFDR